MIIIIISRDYLEPEQVPLIDLEVGFRWGYIDHRRGIIEKLNGIEQCILTEAVVGNYLYVETAGSITDIVYTFIQAPLISGKSQQNSIP